MGAIQIDTTPLFRDLTDLLAEVCGAIRDGADTAAEVAAAEASARCGGTFDVTAEPGQRIVPVGGFHNAGIRVSRRNVTPKSPYYRDPGAQAILFYEFGTSRQPPRPFIRPGLAAGVQAL